MADRYVYLHERLQRALTQQGSSLDDFDLNAEIEEALALPNERDRVLTVFTTEALAAASAHLVHQVEVHAKARNSRRTEVMSRLRRHTECRDVLEELLVERDSLIAAVRSAQEFCFNDFEDGDVRGTLYVLTHRFLDALRPVIASHHRWAPTEFEGTCSSCGDRWIHDESCIDLAAGEDLERRAEHEIRSHGRCPEIADEVLLQIERQYAHIDTIAAHALRWSDHEEGLGHAVDVHKVLELLADEQPCATVACATITAAVSAPVNEADYCQDPDYHSEPHRACRWLVS